MLAFYLGLLLGFPGNASAQPGGGVMNQLGQQVGPMQAPTPEQQQYMIKMKQQKQREQQMKSLQDAVAKSESDVHKSRADTSIKANKGMQGLLIGE
jgi:hypothetical protein